MKKLGLSTPITINVSVAWFFFKPKDLVWADFKVRSLKYN